jgi:hypothetical protein
MTTPTYPFTAEGLAAALKALGSTRQAVADRLREMGIKGCRSDENDCPVAHYVLAVVDGAEGANVEIDVIRAVRRDPESYCDVTVSAFTSEAIAAFMFLFDSNEYRDLIQEAVS